ncbi:DUF1127 domain-containing protein [Labrenzia sp. CE80]|uniref:DUF1127 domain-containing protein n=1 Tax=Labrenzia sp. CE80 TaxID=1788986 RepID=UPI00129B9102|nr:DUF1127 domain-containing protein [Labrenzia sp. CE80]
MALSIVASPFDAVFTAASSVNRAFFAFCDSFYRALEAKTLYAELANMSDEQLAVRGLKREEVSQAVFAKVYDAR